MSWLARSIGDFGNQVGQASEINLDYKTRLQNMLFQQARQKQSDLKNALDMQELQQRIRQMQQPREAGIVKGPGGETYGATFDPATSSYSFKSYIPGALPEPKFKSPLEAMTYYAGKGDAEKFNQFKAIYDASRPQKETPGGYTDTQKDTQGRLWGFNKDTNKYEIIPTPGAKFRGENEKTPSEYDQRITNYLAANGMKDTPANRDKADEALGVRNKQNDRVDATKAVTAAMNAFKNYQSQVAGVQKYSAAVPIYKPWQHFTGQSELEEQAAAAKNDYELKRIDAIQKLQDAGMPVPQWLSTPMPGSGGPPSLPAGYELETK